MPHRSFESRRSTKLENESSLRAATGLDRSMQSGASRRTQALEVRCRTIPRHESARTARWCGACLAFLIAVTVSAAAAEPKRVILLHSFGPDVKPWSDYARAIRAELSRQSPWRLDLYEHSLATARFSDENPEIPFAEYLRALFSKGQPDLIVSIGAPAAGLDDWPR